MHARRNHLTLVGIILAALIGVAFLAIPGMPGHRNVTKGLDIQGGLEVVLKAVPPKGHTLTAEDLDRSVSIMRNRVDKLGVSEPEIRKQEPDEIVIQQPRQMLARADRRHAEALADCLRRLRTGGFQGV